MQRTRRIVGVLALVSSTVALAVGAEALPVSADGPGVGAPWVVSLGDSYISGEAGRWAGNSNSSSASVDAGGPAAYFAGARLGPLTLGPDLPIALTAVAIEWAIGLPLLLAMAARVASTRAEATA